MDPGGLEIWGGVECTVCRIGDLYFDQTVRSGHHARLDDLDRIASLGITHLRYPVLWERVALAGLERADWSWTDERLERLRELGITPIVTLLHHGSGPRDTSLLDEEFPQKLARFARAVAQRYPWLRYFTPVNEPVTTARFAAMYGWWYPHRKSEPEFFRALFQQLRGIRQAMEAIRECTPDARLIVTEDLGKTYATPHLGYQAEFENARRFLSYDLLCGALGENTAMCEHFQRLGLRVDEEFQQSCFCPPDVLGYNYYVTGERWLDERLERYPGQFWGGNERERYADVEAVRVCAEGITGPGPLLEECWQRYKRPLAITEAHLACTREEQVRWLRDIHGALRGLRENGVDVRAMTIWSLLGAFDWNSALTRQDGYYESGAFDVSTGTARETGIAIYVRSLTGRDTRDVPACEGSGWWELPSRLEFEPSSREDGASHAAAHAAHVRDRRPLMILGDSDPLGEAVQHACLLRNLEMRSAGSSVRADELAQFVKYYNAWAVLDCTGADHAWQAGESAYELIEHFEHVARGCGESGVPVAAISSPLVFAGEKSTYLESDDARPDTPGGKAYLRIEETLLRSCSDALIARCGMPFAGAAREGWHDRAVRNLLAGKPPHVSTPYMNAVHRLDLAHALLDALIDGERGIVHAGNAGETHAVEILEAALERLGGWAAVQRPASRSRKYVLSTARIRALRSKDSALKEWVAAV